jgi:FKBP-type peptidyl-prolyl cis-trans isomerase FklB
MTQHIPMKKLLFCILLSSISVALFSQTKKPVAKKAATTAATPAMKNAVDSFSYAIGLSIANFYQQQGVKQINNNLVLQAIKDAQNQKPKMDEAQANNCIVTYMDAIKSEKASGNIAEGKAFLDSNSKRPGVVTLPSGLQYEVIQQGTGAKPVATDKVKVHYHGSLISGKVFDSSIERGTPVEFNVGGVIPGWTEALQLMQVGSKWKLFIPSSLAYGDNQAGPDITPGSTLIFDVELLEIVK